MTAVPGNTKDCFVTVIAVVHNAEDTVRSFLMDTQLCLDEQYSDYEILLLDQGSTDATAATVKSLLTTIPSVRYLRLTFPVHFDVAIAAAVENSIGDYVVFLTPSTDPIGEIPLMVDMCKQGSDVIFGVAKTSNTIGYRLLRPFAEALISQIGYKMPRDVTSFCCLSRRAVNVVTKTGRYHHQFFVKVANTGLPFSIHKYNVLSDDYQHRSLYYGVRKTIRLLVFNSTKPLRWMSSLGLFGSLIAFLFAIYSIAIRLFKDDVIEGWTSMILFMSILFMILFTVLAFFGEYLGRLLDDRSEHKEYSVSYELNSSVMLEKDRVNILTN